MKFVYVHLDGIDFFDMVKDLKTVIAEVIRNDIVNGKIVDKSSSYTSVLKFKELLVGCWEIEVYSFPTDPEDTKRIRFYRKYAYELDEQEAAKYPEGKDSRRFICEYIVKWINDNQEESSTAEATEELSK